MHRIPFLNVYGQISEMYISLKKNSTESFKKSGHWPIFLRTIGLPLSDRIFTERQRNRLARGSSQAAFKLQVHCDRLSKEASVLITAKDERTRALMGKMLGKFAMVKRVVQK